MDDCFSSPVAAGSAELHGATLIDESHEPKWRTWEGSAPLGRSERRAAGLEFSVSPGEWVVLGTRPEDTDAVDLTHVRAMFRLTGPEAAGLLAHVCAIDLGDEMTPDGAAARTLVAGVATELVHDDADGERSYLLLMSRSFARHVWERLAGLAEHRG